MLVSQVLAGSSTTRLVDTNSTISTNLVVILGVFKLVLTLYIQNKYILCSIKYHC
jgi:hypothetical protein